VVPAVWAEEEPVLGIAAVMLPLTLEEEEEAGQTRTPMVAVAVRE
jgi:hypothetical protein